VISLVALVNRCVALRVRAGGSAEPAGPEMHGGEAPAGVPTAVSEQEAWKLEMSAHLAFTRSLLALGKACPDNPYGRLASETIASDVRVAETVRVRD
jgi:hypothetical protein